MIRKYKDERQTLCVFEFLPKFAIGKF